MNSVFLMDPLATCVPDKDTSLGLMLSAQAAGHRVYYWAPEHVGHGQSTLSVIELSVREHPTDPICNQVPVDLPVADCDVIWIRLNPPFDHRYLQLTWLLDQLPKHIRIINSTHGLRTVNEKLWALQFSDHIPDTIVSTQLSDYQDFLAKHKTIIIKPTDHFGGQGIFKIHHTDTNRSVAFELLSHGETRPVIIQALVPEAHRGDKRILLLNGKPLGAVLRRQTGDDHRHNLAAGGHAEPADITANDQAIIDAVAPSLVGLGLHFVGLDILGDRLIEVNVTSPTCLRELSKFHGCDMGAPILDWLNQSFQA
jgi:glutathione synthase